MKRSDFFYDLPRELIAQYPLQHREDSRLLCLSRKSGKIKDDKFNQLPVLLQQDDLLIFNDSKVIPARLFAQKDTGGRVEILVERIIDNFNILAQVKANKSPKIDTRITLDDEHTFLLTGREEEFFKLKLESGGEIFPVLEKFGHVPLPPYIKRDDDSDDKDRYQTVYAKNPGAVAAPTAGLHFSEGIIQRLQDHDIQTGFVTLHVGAGTFQPVRCNDIENHKMHKEWFSISEELCNQIDATKQRGGRIIAVGTTVVRTLESAATNGKLASVSRDTDIFIYPGYEFKIIDGLITNFHLPESTLMMLISAFAGRELIMSAYHHAIAEKYRFFSYGDAMLVL